MEFGDEDNRYGGAPSFGTGSSSGTNSADSRHVPPHSLEAERSVIGALLIDSAAYAKVVDIGLQPIDFYRESHGKIFEAIQDLTARSEPADLVTLTTTLKNRGTFDLVGGSSYLTGLFEDAYSSAHITHYSKIVKEKAILRRLISTANELVGTAFSGVDDVEEFLDHAEKAVFEVTDSKLRQSFVGIKQILMENMQSIEELAQKKATVTGLPTGFTELDRMTSGLHPGNLVIVAGRPAMGKTSLVLNLAENAALQGKASVALFSL
ncbi:MAG TPA: DnaB-like helicase N-terminal domain-containing protein, partial [Oligoflexia bacterium]|nr:DnaB-like helicase N-terminal domain-containing protein [Oligoflexia bacterium]